MTDDAVKVKQLIADGHDMYVVTSVWEGAWRSVIRAAVHGGCVRSIEAFLQAGAPLPYGFHFHPNGHSGYPSLLMIDYEARRMVTTMTCVLIEHGAWFSTTEESQFSSIALTRPIFAYDYRAQLAACRLAQRALGRVLRGRVHRNVIPMIEARVWSTRRDDRWLDAKK